MNDVEKLIKDNKRLIDLEASRYASNLPLIMVQLEAYKLAREAARSYNPSSGFKFSTHLVNSLKKLSRMSTQYGGAIRLPENTQFGINKLQKMEMDLTHTLGREPTVSEIAEQAGMGVKGVAHMMDSRRNTAAMSLQFDAPTHSDSGNDEWVHFVYHDLSAIDKSIFEHKTGFGGKKVLENKAIAKKLHLSTGTLNNRIKLMNTTLAKGWK